MLIVGAGGELDALDSMYPSYGFLTDYYRSFDEFYYSTLYGYATGPVNIKVNPNLFDEDETDTITLEGGQYISLPLRDDSVVIQTVSESLFFGVFRLGFIGQFVVGQVENRGRLCYIDGCSDSLLVYPPRQGDPSLNSLHFPPGIKQSFHTHPSIRMGFIAEGSGLAWRNGPNEHEPLKKGQAFMLSEQELHRFSTHSEGMTVIAFHPDGDWGPTDQNHTMLNRTYLK